MYRSIAVFDSEAEARDAMHATPVIPGAASIMHPEGDDVHFAVFTDEAQAVYDCNSQLAADDLPPFWQVPE